MLQTLGKFLQKKVWKVLYAYWKKANAFLSNFLACSEAYCVCFVVFV